MRNIIKMVTIEPEYIKHIFVFDSKISYNSKKLKQTIGLLMKINNNDYFIPLSSPKTKHKNMNDTLDMLKIKNGVYGVINFNNMIPINSKFYTEIDFKNEKNKKEKKYNALLNNQMRWVSKNNKKITNKAYQLYELYKNNKLPKYIRNRCCNFIELEYKLKNYVSPIGMKGRYIIDYKNEEEFKKLERSLKKYNMVAYKKLMFDFYPKLRGGEFIGELVSINNYEHTETYDLKIATDSLFVKVYGEVKLNYTVYKEYNIVILNNLEPKDILLDAHRSELISYKGIMISKANAEKEMFKIDLLCRLEGRE